MFDEEHLFEDGLPAFGNVFTTQGYIYPSGTLTCTDGGCNGVLADGSPEFPGKVLGEWSCWGTHVGDGARTASGPWVLSTQQFNFGVPVTRAIQGGTGEFNSAEGQQRQVLLGFNSSNGVGLKVKLRIRVQ